MTDTDMGNGLPTRFKLHSAMEEAERIANRMNDAIVDYFDAVVHLEIGDDGESGCRIVGI